MTTPGKRSVIVTGASSGIGKACVARMTRSGWIVIAGVRKSTDADKLKREFSDSIVPVILDVEDQDSIHAVAHEVQAKVDRQGLHGLVNVAGIGMTRPLEYVNPEDLEKMFRVNVFGQIAVTQAFLPSIRTAHGRIVNISSIGAHIAIPFFGLLNATKAAFGLLSDAMRLELRPFGIRVSTVEPGSIHTPAVDKTLGNVEEVIRSLDPAGEARYGAMMRQFTRRAYKREMAGSAPEVVAESVHHALTAKRPRIRYVVGKDARLLSILPKVVPERALDHIRLHLFGLPTEFNAVSSDRVKESATHPAQKPIRESSI